MIKILAVAAAGAFWLTGCAEQGNEMGSPAETEIGNEGSTMGTSPSTSTATNIQEGAIDTSPGAGSAVGGDPAGAGTAPLREDNNPQE